MTVRHIVVFRFRHGTEAAAIDRVVSAFRALLQGLGILDDAFAVDYTPQ